MTRPNPIPEPLTCPGRAHGCTLYLCILSAGKAWDSTGSDRRKEWWKWSKWQHGKLVAQAVLESSGADSKPAGKLAAKPDPKPAAQPAAKLAPKPTAKPAAKRATEPTAKPAAKPAGTQHQLELALAAASTRPDPEAAAFKGNLEEWHRAQAAWVNSWEGEACGV